jgi:hypothetical protein
VRRARRRIIFAGQAALITGPLIIPVTKPEEKSKEAAAKIGETKNGHEKLRRAEVASDRCTWHRDEIFMR